MSLGGSVLTPVQTKQIIMYIHKRNFSANSTTIQNTVNTRKYINKTATHTHQVKINTV
jgi:hypothetical protein